MRAPTWRSEARVGLTVYGLVLIVTLCVWGTWYLLPCAFVAFGGSTLVLIVRFMMRVYRNLDTARSALSMTSPLRLPSQETRDDVRS